MILDWTDDALLQRMRAGWRGLGTDCGIGSTFAHTRNVVRWLPQMMAKYGLTSLCDAGAGDLEWKRGMVVDFDYRAFDLVPRLPEVTELDITTTPLPPCDAILCRAVLIHLDPPRVQRALALFRESAPWLFATSEPSDNAFDPASQYNPIDLTEPPYNLGPPLESVADLEGPRSLLGLWRLRK